MTDAELRRLAAAEKDAARYRLLADRMVHVAHPAGSGWTLDEVLVSNDADLDATVDALAKEQICAVAKNIQIPEATRWVKSHTAPSVTYGPIAERAADGKDAGLWRPAAPSVVNLTDPAVQKRLAAQWGYVPAAPSGEGA